MLSVYTYGDPAVKGKDLTQTELHVYGSSRLGILKAAVDVEGAPAVTTSPLPPLGTIDSLIFTRGNKLFELTNHLGNVLATISDKRYGVSTDDSTVTYFIPEVVSANDYYPFGSLQPNRSYTESGVGSYRFGFNGKEKDDEVKGQADQIDFGARIYDARVGRFLSGDPLERTYPWQSTYAFAHNNPIKLIDLLGMGGEDPTPVYHRTSSANAASISQSGFDPGKSNRNGFTYFSTSPGVSNIGTSAASGNTVVQATVDLSGARTISKQQMTQWFNDGLSAANKELNTKYSSISEVPNELQSRYQSIADGVRNAKLADFMKADGGSVYNIAGKNTIAVAESAISGVKVTGLSGSGAAEAIQMMTRPSMDGEVSAALKEYGKAASTIKWVGRACLAIAVASDVYEIYQSNNKMRTITTKVGGWSGAIAGASAFAAWGAGGGSIVPGAGNLVGGIGGGIVGGIVGYWAGSTVSEAVYDYLFTKGINAK